MDPREQHLIALRTGRQHSGMAIDPATIPACHPGAHHSCLDATIPTLRRKGHPG